MLDLDLTIRLIHVIAQTDTKNPSVHRYLTKSVANWEELSSFILDIFSNFSATKAN